jgi:hypothetical protein
VALIDKSEFVGLDGVAHLCTGGEAPWLRAHTAACERFGALKSAGMAGREEMFAIGERRAPARRGCWASSPARSPSSPIRRKA